MGASIDLSRFQGNDGVDDFTALLSESGARALVAVPEWAVAAVSAAAEAEGVAWARLGTTGGDMLVVSGTDLLGEAGEGPGGAGSAEGAAGGPLVLDLAELRESLILIISTFFCIIKFDFNAPEVIFIVNLPSLFFTSAIYRQTIGPNISGRIL